VDVPNYLLDTFPPRQVCPGCHRDFFVLGWPDGTFTGQTTANERRYDAEWWRRFETTMVTTSEPLLATLIGAAEACLLEAEDQVGAIADGRFSDLEELLPSASRLRAVIGMARRSVDR